MACQKKTLLQEFCYYTSFNILSMIGLSVYILADTYFISSGIGTTGLTALNLALPVYSLVNGIGLMLGIGGAARFIISRTMHQREASDTAFSTAVAAGIFVGIALALVGIFFGDRIAVLLGADAVSFDDTAVYLRVILLFAPMFILNNIFSAFVKNDGAPHLAMAGMLSGSFFNIVFDYILVFPCHLGMFGAVLATGLSPVVGISVLSIRFIRKKNAFSFRLRKVSGKVLLAVLSGGVPALVNELAYGIVLLVFNHLILSLAGNIGVAAYGVLANLLLVVTAVYNGLAQGVQPLFGRAYAKGERKAETTLLRYALTSAVIFSALFYLAAVLLPDVLTSLFNSSRDAKMQALAVTGFPLYFLQCLPLGCNTVLIMFFLSIEKTLQSKILSLLKGFGIVVPLSLLFARLFGMRGIWLAMPVTEFLVLALGLLFLSRLSRAGNLVPAP
ncbi:MAG: MATE family efflux transporter [Lachnospiraceae bacterium]